MQYVFVRLTVDESADEYKDNTIGKLADEEECPTHNKQNCQYNHRPFPSGPTVDDESDYGPDQGGPSGKERPHPCGSCGRDITDVACVVALGRVNMRKGWWRYRYDHILEKMFFMTLSK